MHLQAADAHPAVARGHLELVTDAHGARQQRAGHHRAESMHREHAVDGQPHAPFRRAGLHLRGGIGQRAAQGIEALAGP